VLAADAATPPLEVPRLSEGLRGRLQEVLPPGGAAANPVDALASASPETFAQILERLDVSGEIDVHLPILMHPVTLDAEAAAASIVGALARARHPAAIVWMGGTGDDPVARGLRAAGLAVFSEPARATAALSAWARVPPGRDEAEWPPVAAGKTSPLLRSGGPPDPAALERALEGGAIRGPACARVGDIASALAAAERIGFPVVLKVERLDAPHKAAAGLLAFADGAGALREALERLRPAADGQARWLVQERVAPGPEIYAACLVHPRLGAFVAVGRGGTGVEGEDPPGWLAVPARESAERAFWKGPHVPVELRREGGRGLVPLRTLVERLARLALGGEVTMAEVNPAIWNRERNVLRPVDSRWQPRAPVSSHGC
jgi:acetyltransferase